MRLGVCLSLLRVVRLRKPYPLPVLLATILICPWHLPAVDVNSLPPRTGYVDDFAHVLNPADQAQLTTFCGSVERQLGVQFALVTVDTIDDTPVEDYGVQLARKWGIGDRKSSQGLLLLLVIRDHKSDIETGRGIEPFTMTGSPAEPCAPCDRVCSPGITEWRY